LTTTSTVVAAVGLNANPQLLDIIFLRRLSVNLLTAAYKGISCRTAGRVWLIADHQPSALT
jgi:hypothetical protein